MAGSEPRLHSLFIFRMTGSGLLFKVTSYLLLLLYASPTNMSILTKIVWHRVTGFRRIFIAENRQFLLILANKRLSFAISFRIPEMILRIARASKVPGPLLAEINFLYISPSE